MLGKTSYASYEIICINGIINLTQDIIKFNTKFRIFQGTLIDIQVFQDILK